MTMTRTASTLLVALFAILAGLHTLAYPFGTDQGEYAVTAEAAMQGRVIYRDVFCVKPPLTYMLHEFALRKFGRSMASIRALDVFWQAATAVVILLVARRAFGREDAALAAGLLYPLTYYGFMQFWATAQTDGFLNLPTALAVWAALASFRAATVRERGPRDPASPISDGHGSDSQNSSLIHHAGLPLLSGACLGIAFLFKYPIGALLPLLMLWLICDGGLRQAAAMAVGFIAVLALQAAALAAQGSLGDFRSTASHYYASYTFGAGRGESFVAAVIGGLRHSLHKFGRLGLLLGVSATGLLFALRGPRRQGSAAIMLWWLAALIHVAAQKRFFLYHWLPLLAPAALLTGLLLTSATDRLRRAPRRWTLALLAAAAMIWLQADRRADWRALWQAARHEQPLRTAYHDAQGYAIESVLAVGDYVRTHSRPDEPLFVWCFDPPLYFAAQRPPATRFIYNFVLFGKWNWPELRQQCIADLARSRPRYIVVRRGDGMAHMTGVPEDSWTAMQQFPALREMLTTQYREETSIQHFVLFRRIAD